MRWIAEIFARAMVRRLAYVLVGALFLFLSRNASAATYDDEGLAYQACIAGIQSLVQSRNNPYDSGQIRCVKKTDYYQGQFQTCGDKAHTSCSWANGSLYDWAVGQTCASRQEEFDWSPDNPLYSCYQGCVYKHYEDPDTHLNFWSTYDSSITDPLSNFKVCSVGDGSSPPSPAPPSVPPPTDPPPTDGGNDGGNPSDSGNPSDGGGGGDGGGDGPPHDGQQGDGNFSDGGGDCASPPSCFGDSIQCNQLYQLWRIRCSEIAGLSGQSFGSGNGDGSSPGNGQGNGQGDFDGSPPPFPSQGEGEDPDPSKLVKTINFDPSNILDRGGFGLSSTCPVFPDLHVMGQTIDMSLGGKWCDLLAVVRACLILLGAFIAISILLDRG
jgi:hypothetical protein